MNNTFGRKIKLTVFGDSHGPYVGATIENMPAGIKIDRTYIENELKKRRPYGPISTSRVENDDYEFISGIKDNVTNGEPITVHIKNNDIDNTIYEKNYGKARPSHADYTSFVKYNGNEEYRGGGKFSGRMTAPLVLLGSICKLELEKRGIFIGTHIYELAGIKDDELTDESIKQINESLFPVINDSVREKMVAEILKAKDEKDSIGGVLETKIVGLKAGIGEPFFDSLESLISHAIFSIPGVKGITFGDAEKLCDMRGSSFNDEMRYENERVITLSNHNGGINGGISNGMPVIFKTYVKPTPSISKKQKTIDFIKKENIDLEIEGRHDPCIAHRVRAVVDNLVAVVVFSGL